MQIKNKCVCCVESQNSLFIVCVKWAHGPHERRRANGYPLDIECQESRTILDPRRHHVFLLVL